LYFFKTYFSAYRHTEIRLTNPLARENFEKYGHPDGPQSLNTFFAIPQWFVEKRNYWKVSAAI
jgi:translocation protein SEC63